MSALIQSECPDLKLLARGKVRDVYEVNDSQLLFVASDRISAFDVVMKNGISDKGKLLTQMSCFWFGLLGDLCPQHFITANVDEMPEAVRQYADQLEGRSMLVKKLTILPVEAIVRGYIAGSGWSEYKKQGTVCDIQLPTGLRQCDKLDQPLYTPSTKAEIGDHDENIHPDKVAEILGVERAQEVADLSLKIYATARDYAVERGIIIADTKFEFGVDENGVLHLADEVLSPDSSRFWPANDYQPGRNQASFDKQFIRDYLESINFDKQNAIELPDDIIARSQKKYIEAYKLLTGAEPNL